MRDTCTHASPQKPKTTQNKKKNISKNPSPGQWDDTPAINADLDVTIFVDHEDAVLTSRQEHHVVLKPLEPGRQSHVTGGVFIHSHPYLNISKQTSEAHARKELQKKLIKSFPAFNIHCTHINIKVILSPPCSHSVVQSLKCSVYWSRFLLKPTI